MPDDDNNFAEPPYLRRIREEQERLRDLVDPPYLRSIREEHERLSNLVNPPELSLIREAERLRDLLEPPHLMGITETYARFGELLDPPHLKLIREEQEHLRDLKNLLAHKTIRDLDLYSRELTASHVHIAAGLASATDYARSAELFGCGASLVESALRMGHLDRGADIVAMAASGISKLATQISTPNFGPVGDLLNASVDFFDFPIEEGPLELVTHVPPEIFRAIDLDSALHGNTNDQAKEERNELALTTSDELETALARFNPELVALWKGARRAVFSDNPDRTRHISISLRELLGHALRRLAPDTAIASWTQQPAHFDKGKPTRRARLEYLYSSVEATPLRKLVEADIRAAIELFDVLSAGAHVVNLGANTDALMLMLTRAEGILLLLLRLGICRIGDA